MIPHSRPLLGRAEEEAVRKVLRSGQVGPGPEGERLEAEFARLSGTDGAVALGSGTAALAAGLLALRLPPRSGVLVPSAACPAFLQACRMAGARAVPYDCEPRTCLPDRSDLRRRARGRVRAAILFHPFGLPADPAAVPRGLEILEASTHALGTHFGRAPVGSLGRFSFCSLYATKPVCGAAGGLVASDDAGLLRRVRGLRSYDERRDAGPRWSARLPDLLAAVARTQLSRLPAFLRRRRSLARRYLGAITGARTLPPPDPPDSPHAWYRFVAAAPGGAARALAAFARAGIAARRPVFWPLHRALGLPGFPGAEEAWRALVSVPLYPALRGAEVRRILRALRRILGP